MPDDNIIEIPLTKGYSAIVDKEDADLASTYWYVAGSRQPIACRRMHMDETDYHLGKHVLMHRIMLERILQHPIPDGYECDHINKNALDNRRSNLRLATRSQNCQNRKGWSKYGRGVYYDKGRYIAKICVGSFNTPEEAESAWLKAARLLRGEFAIPDEA